MLPDMSICCITLDDFKADDVKADNIGLADIKPFDTERLTQPQGGVRLALAGPTRYILHPDYCAVSRSSFCLQSFMPLDGRSGLF